MNAVLEQPAEFAATERYAKCIDASKRVRWEIDRHVIRGRNFDFKQKFLPDGLSFATKLAFLSADERKFLSRVQGRTYANMFGLVERFIGAKMMEVNRDHGMGDQVAMEALVRFIDEELKHQALFRQVEEMMAAGMPAGYAFVPEPNAVAEAVLSKSTWAVLALTCHIEIFTQIHYRESIDPDAELSELWKDIFLFHWKEESQHAILDEMEWAREDAKLAPAERDAAVNDFIALVGAVDGILQAQAAEDAKYFAANCGRKLSRDEQSQVQATMLEAYRYQYIVSGAQAPRFLEMLTSLIDTNQAARIMQALEPILH